MSRILALSSLLLLAACSSNADKPAPAQLPPPPPSGLESLLGKPVQTAIDQLGAPHLDKVEGPSRQLQFVGSCVLDIWYYPRETYGLVATHAEARLPNGQDVAPGQCRATLMAQKDNAVAAAAATARARTEPAPKTKPAKQSKARRD